MEAGMRRQLLALGTAVLVLGVMAAPGMAAPLSSTPPVLVSGASPFAPGCGGSAEGSFSAIAVSGIATERKVTSSSESCGSSRRLLSAGLLLSAQQR